jgi:hypothetical protein
VALGLLEALDHSIAFVAAVGIGNSELPWGIRGGVLLIESGERSSRAHGLRWCSRFFFLRASPIGVSGIMVELRFL